MNELKTKNDTPAEEARPKQSRWRRLPKGGRAAVVALGIVRKWTEVPTNLYQLLFYSALAVGIMSLFVKS